MRDKNKIILIKIIEYCNDIEDAKSKYQIYSIEVLQDKFMKAMIGMFILQIGELAKQFTEEFIQGHTQIPWRSVKRMRDIYAHQYHMINTDYVWDTMNEDIPALKDFCVITLRDEFSDNDE